MALSLTRPQPCLVLQPAPHDGSQNPLRGFRSNDVVGVRRHAAVQWRQRLGIVRSFARHLKTVDPRTEVPPDDLLKVRRERITPDLYSDEDITGLMRAARDLQPAWRAVTFEVLIGLLAVTGARLGEILGLDRLDVDFDGRLLVLRRTKLAKAREVHLQATTSDTCGQCWARRAWAPSRPRPHDLRHSFAVRTLLDWHEAAVDVEANLPRLSTHLGHTGPAATYWHLQAAPELFAVPAPTAPPGSGEEATRCCSSPSEPACAFLSSSGFAVETSLSPSGAHVRCVGKGRICRLPHMRPRPSPRTRSVTRRPCAYCMPLSTSPRSPCGLATSPLRRRTSTSTPTWTSNDGRSTAPRRPTSSPAATGLPTGFWHSSKASDPPNYVHSPIAIAPSNKASGPTTRHIPDATYGRKERCTPLTSGCPAVIRGARRRSATVVSARGGGRRRPQPRRGRQ